MLGEQAYHGFFSDVPFARIGGPKGTSARLRAWLAALANMINGGSAPPAAVAHTLRFLMAPSFAKSGYIPQELRGALPPLVQDTPRSQSSELPGGQKPPLHRQDTPASEAT